MPGKPDTKIRLMDGALETVRTHGIAATSARTIAAAAGVNQALIFYHFGSIDELLTAAAERSTAERVAAYTDRLAAVRSLRELLVVGRELHEEERALGNVNLLAQMLAGARNNEVLATACAAALAQWMAPIESTLARLLQGSPLEEVTDVAGLARAVSASFIGLEMYDGVDPAGAASAFTALEQLGVLMEIVDDLGPVARRAVRARITRTARRRPA
ncbi:TetR/AcrR family transcriptional regulator [Hamadaea tsunoensis]|uniref:TetR/AcrR family transcriptional regulator n=1 Tax=Hamadaea tsunoensis TaxID=53368 RepID=UPI0004883F62|nr:TetR/AcrR family transcriptional regulator [Hamadaea tsunoensis]